MDRLFNTYTEKQVLGIVGMYHRNSEVSKSPLTKEN